ncbi:MAG: hypothetical protein IJN48_00415 [Clostridia bacterium]|nr:hypothetical protein [Clostridia bacterium]
MDIKKLYSDACILVGEIPVYSFLTHCDMFARSAIAKYGNNFAVGEGEYTSPDSLSDSFAIDDAFYNAALFYAAGRASGNDQLQKKSDNEAEIAYRSLWRKNAKGKRIMGVNW